MTTALPHSPADILMQWLLDNTHATDPQTDAEWPGFVNTAPDSPDNSVATYDTAGLKQGATPGGPVIFYGCQLSVRAKDQRVAWKKADAMATALDAVPSTGMVVTIQDRDTALDVSYRLWHFTRGPVTAAGQSPETRRHLYTINGRVSISKE